MSLTEWVRSLCTEETVKVILTYAEVFFVLYLAGYATFLFASMLAGSSELFEDVKKKRLHNEIHHDYYVPISIIVPARNEELTIVQTLRSLLRLDYRCYEIIVVDDGSSDATAERVRESFSLRAVQRPLHRSLPCGEVREVFENGEDSAVHITLLCKENGGKADAINAGINAAGYPYFVCMDADSILQRDSLKRIAAPVLEDTRVVAVGSMIRISNDSEFADGEPVRLRLPKKLLPAFQVLEYERSFLASRILLDRFNANLIVSGAFGLFRRDVVVQVGGYPVHSMGEDMELIMKLHAYCRANRLDYRIRYAYDAVCWTQVPERLVDLMRQRRRWHIGLMQSLWGQRSIAGKGSYLYYLFYELLSPPIELLGILITLLAACHGLLNLPYMIAFFLIYAVFGAMLTVIAYLARNFRSDTHLGFSDVLRALLLCVPENAVIRLLLSWTRLIAVLFYRGKKTSWGKIRRYEIRERAAGRE